MKSANLRWKASARWFLALGMASAFGTLAFGQTPDPLRLVVFGDGFSDTGNAYNASARLGDSSPPAPYWQGRFSDGEVWVDYVAAGLRVAAPQPSVVGGANYAWGGAHASSSSMDARAPSLGEQVHAYLQSGGLATEQHLFLVWAGATDFLDCDFQTTAQLPDPSKVARSVAEAISAIASSAEAGTKLRFVVGNLPPLGQTARAHWLGETLDPEIPRLMDRLSAQFNAQLAAELRWLESNHGIEVLELDADSLTRRVVTTPEDYGLTDVNTPARVGVDGFGGPARVSTPGTELAPNAREHLFFDAVHPTSRWHEALAGMVLSLMATEP